eukprot:4698911-Alexandrium_andersonii.AAC.1
MRGRSAIHPCADAPQSTRRRSAIHEDDVGGREVGNAEGEGRSRTGSERELTQASSKENAARGNETQAA